jgi:hypothetical protein
LRVVGRRSGVGGAVSQSPRFSTPLIGLRLLRFVGALWARRTLVLVPWLVPLFIVALRERGPTAIHDRRPRSGRGSDRFPDPEITFLTPDYPKKNLLCDAMQHRTILDSSIYRESLLNNDCTTVSRTCTCVYPPTRPQNCP